MRTDDELIRFSPKRVPLTDGAQSLKDMGFHSLDEFKRWSRLKQAEYEKSRGAIQRLTAREDVSNR